MAREDLHFRLRIPEYLKELVEAAAQRNKTSMTAEIIARLHEIYADEYLVLRVPEALQQRVAAYATRQHRSLNEEIVRILEREFPAPLSLETRVEDLIGLIEVLRSQGAKEELVDRLNDELYEMLKGIALGRVKGVDDSYRAQVKERLQDWEIEQTKDQEHRYTAEMDQEELDSLWLRGDPFKNDV